MSPALKALLLCTSNYNRYCARQPARGGSKQPAASGTTKLSYVIILADCIVLYECRKKQKLWLLHLKCTVQLRGTFALCRNVSHSTFQLTGDVNPTDHTCMEDKGGYKENIRRLHFTSTSVASVVNYTYLLTAMVICVNGLFAYHLSCIILLKNVSSNPDYYTVKYLLFREQFQKQRVPFNTLPWNVSVKRYFLRWAEGRDGKEEYDGRTRGGNGAHRLHLDEW